MKKIFGYLAVGAGVVGALHAVEHETWGYGLLWLAVEIFGALVIVAADRRRGRRHGH